MPVVIVSAPDAKWQPHAVVRHLVRACDNVLVLDPEVVDQTVMVRSKGTSDHSHNPSPQGPTAAPGHSLTRQP